MKPGITTRPAALISTASRIAARFSTRRDGPHLAEYAAADESHPISDYAQFVQPDSATRRSRAAQPQQLFRASYKYLSQVDPEFTIISVKYLITGANYG